MASRGTVKQVSVEHEDFIASVYNGTRSPSSGGASHDQGDVRTASTLIECKAKGSPRFPPTTTPTLLQQFEKVAREAWSEGREPAVALRFYDPSSPLANLDGWIDLIVRRVADDAAR